MSNRSWRIPLSEDRDRLRELEVVQVAVDDDVRVRIRSEDLGDEVVDDLRLLVPLHLGDPRGRLEAALQRVVAALRVEVVGDHEQVLPSNVNSPASGLRLAFQAVFAGSIRPGLNVSCGDEPDPDDADRCGRGAAGPVDEREPAVGAEEEDLADVAARLAAVLVVDGVDAARSS